MYCQQIIVVNGLSVEYVKTRQIVPTKPNNLNMATLKNQLQAEMNIQNLDCTVEKVYKIRLLGIDQETIVVETLAPAASPVSDLIVMGIILIILAAIGVYAYVHSMGFRERRWNEANQMWETFVQDVVQGFTHESVSEMIKWKRENHPELYAQYPHWCPYCGAEFETATERDNHVQICPEAPVTPPPVPDGDGGWVPGVWINYAVNVLGYRLTGTRQTFLSWFRRR